MSASHDTPDAVEKDGRKYLRPISHGFAGRQTVDVDVYDVLVAFKVTCPARAHAIKKLLCAGQRGKGSVLDDLLGAAEAVAMAVDLRRCREADGLAGGA